MFKKVWIINTLKLLLVIIITLSLVSCNNSSDFEKNFPFESHDSWKACFYHDKNSKNETYYYYNRSLFQVKSTNIVFIWFKIIILNESIDIQKYTARNIPHYLRRMEVDCDEERMRTIEFYKVDNTITNENISNYNWDKVLPNTYNEFLYKKACDSDTYYFYLLRNSFRND